MQNIKNFFLQNVLFPPYGQIFPPWNQTPEKSLRVAVHCTPTTRPLVCSLCVQHEARVALSSNSWNLDRATEYIIKNQSWAHTQLLPHAGRSSSLWIALCTFSIIVSLVCRLSPHSLTIVRIHSFALSINQKKLCYSSHTILFQIILSIRYSGLLSKILLSSQFEFVILESA